MEVFSMKAQYFRDITEHGIDEAKKLAFLVEKGSDAVHSKTYRTTREALTGRMEVEAAKHLAKCRLDRARKGGQRANETAALGEPPARSSTPEQEFRPAVL